MTRAAATCALAAAAASALPAGSGAWTIEPVRGRQYLYAVELASFVGRLDGEQQLDGVRSEVHATARYRGGARHANVDTVAYYADEHGPGIAPWGGIRPPIRPIRWRGRITAIEELPGGDDDAPPHTRARDCPLPWRNESGRVEAEWPDGAPLFVSFLVPSPIDACGMRTPVNYFSDTGADRSRVAVAPGTMRKRRPVIRASYARTVRGEGGTWTMRWRGVYRLRRVYSCPAPGRMGAHREIGCISHFLRRD